MTPLCCKIWSLPFLGFCQDGADGGVGRKFCHLATLGVYRAIFRSSTRPPQCGFRTSSWEGGCFHGRVNFLAVGLVRIAQRTFWRDILFAEKGVELECANTFVSLIFIWWLFCNFRFRIRWWPCRCRNTIPNRSRTCPRRKRETSAMIPEGDATAALYRVGQKHFSWYSLVLDRFSNISNHLSSLFIWK